MSSHSVFFLCPPEEVAFLPTSLPLLKKNLHGHIEDIHVLGQRDEKLQRVAYDRGAKFETITGDLNWEKTLEIFEKSGLGDRILLWFPRMLLIKSWNAGAGQEIKVFGDGHGAAFSRKMTRELLGSITGPLRPQDLMGLSSHPSKVKIINLHYTKLRTWDQHLGLGGMFTDGVTFSG